MQLRHLLPVVCVLLFANQASSRPISPGDRLADSAPGRRLRQAGAASSGPDDYVVIFRDGISDVPAATAQLLQDFQQLNAAAAVSESAAAAAAAAEPASVLQVVSSLGVSSPSPVERALGPETSGSAAILDRPTTAQTTAARGLRGVVVRGMNAEQAAALAAASSVVDSVFLDFVIRAAGNVKSQQDSSNCLPVDKALTYQALSKGFESTAPLTPSPKAFKWSGCLEPKTRLLWSGQRCSTYFNQILYTQVVALTPNGAVARSTTTGEPCVLLRNLSKTAWSRLRFGECGTPPTWAGGLYNLTCPVRVPMPGCVRTKAVAGQQVGTVTTTLTAEVSCGGKRYKQLTYTGFLVGNMQLFQWIKAVTPDGCELKPTVSNTPKAARFNQDVFGSLGVLPALADTSMPQSGCGDGGGSNIPPDDPPSPSPSVGSASPPHVLPRTLLQPGQVLGYNLNVTEAVQAGRGVDVTQLQQQLQSPPPRVVVAVADTGIDKFHDDLAYTGGRSFRPVDPSAKVPVFDDPGVDTHGHGTAVSGIIGAKNDGKGVVGVAAGLPLFSLQVLGGPADEEPTGKISYVLQALDWVLTNWEANNIRIINLSLEEANYPKANPRYQDTYKAVCGATQRLSDVGVLVVASAGNRGEDLAGTFPAACPSVLVATAYDSDLSPTGISNWLPDNASEQDRAHVMAAPGQDIYSTAPRNSPKDYSRNYGTSFAAPHLAAIAANCLLSGDCTQEDTGAAIMAKIQAAAKEREQLAGSGDYPWPALQGAQSGRFYGLRAWSKY